jgi:hypothetical protein
MTEPNQPATPTAPPTTDDLAAIAKAATDAAERAESAAAAVTAAGTAAQDEATARGLGQIPQEIVDQIAAAASAATITSLEQRGAFRTEPDPPAAGDTPADTPADEGPPRPRTFAERFLGING